MPYTEEDREDGLEEETGVGIYFTIFVNAKSGGGLVFDCNTLQRELTIYRIRKLEEYLKHKSHEAPEVMCPVYLGPCFLNLGNNLQKGFLEFLESLGITEAVLDYIERSVTEKEQKLYIKWMEDINSTLKSIC